MKSRIITLNSKYIHTALALRLLYVASYPKHDIDFKDYTIKDPLEHIVFDVLQDHIDILAISTYIWNVEYVRQLCTLLKERLPELVIILGGPEVTYEPAHFLEHFNIDYVISGEGEVVFERLLTTLEENQEVQLAGVSYQKNGRLYLSDAVVQCDLSVIEKLPSPYLLEQDRPHLKHRILYFEASRGCPYQCQYCLSSLENGVRHFSREYIYQQLKDIMASEVRTIKFLDRSFNANPQYALDILSFIVEHHQVGQQFQFEINADVLDQRIVDYVNQYAPIGLFRFEIGIQSTYEPTNVAIRRYQNFDRLSSVIRQLMQGGKVDLHLDLIAGLPYESFERFAQSFDDVFAFRAKELQLGFLKLLRGTGLRKQAQDYQYAYQEEPPYEMLHHHVLSSKDVEEIHVVEDMLEKYWNSGRFEKTMHQLMDHVASPFYFFLDLGHFYEQHHYQRIGYQRETLFEALMYYMKEKDLPYFGYLLEDYLGQSKTKPKRFYPETMSFKQRRAVLDQIIHDQDFLAQHQLHQDKIYRYGRLERIGDHHYLLAIYQDFKCQLIHYRGEVYE